MKKLRVAALFAGIGGVELGLSASGHETCFLCEYEPAAQAVLKSHFPDIPLHPDVRDLRSLPPGTDLLTAGFPCQDLSQAGETRGIDGARSGLVGEVFRLLRKEEIPTVLLENVPFMLQLDQGKAMRIITAELEKLGYSWAYRVLDSRAFGLPQRRQRVFLIASKEFDPAGLLFQDDAGMPAEVPHAGVACGFYWTEGLRGLGWAVDAVPTLKGGSTIGIPSPPAIWFPDGRIATPDLCDAERLQGFSSGWTEPAEKVAKRSHRWKLIGNAVSVNTAAWVGQVIGRTPSPHNFLPLPFDQYRSWPFAAYGAPDGSRFEAPVSSWPVRMERQPLAKFLSRKPAPLSHRAVSGFLSRLKRGNLRYPSEFLHALEKHKSSTAPKVEAA
ncbi:MAG: DNA (cytosine-5-)-methyltransferase [Verrucomicrobiae bacterium]|nr:DNA (cytosine-5-)-methyltransferase [Verrucomicrobiae bacterium]MCB1132019.1 DNA (cytosine-5-)-methyltransferase [Verrucomicrobiae bacterium]MCP5533879.1 DNA (cytosine-5-)-methyltransferase [Akkermansiaceae bacterium]MCP5547863.1 DNA (cytosine-5-)-methyltransferase [Akkermansiaceae bacterium]